MFLHGISGILLGFLFSLCFVEVLSQTVDVQTIGRDLRLRYTVIENNPVNMGYIGRITLTNTGTAPIPAQGWAIYFCHQSLFVPRVYNFATKRYPSQLVLSDRSFTLQHIKGCMFRLEPYTGANTTFSGLEPGGSTVINFIADQNAISKYNIYPNWYIADSRNRTSFIQNTVSEDRTFVTPSDLPNAYMRSPADVSLTPWDRYERPEFPVDMDEKACIIPSPTFYSGQRATMNVGRRWKIYSDPRADLEFKDIQKVKDLITAGFGLRTVTGNRNENRVIGLYIGKKAELSDEDQPQNYTIRVESSRVGIFAHTEEALFHGVKTLINMRNPDGSLPIVIIQDEPRFPYRGLKLDVASNFFDKDTVKKIIEAMSQYKLNKLKLCMADNEGWRIEVPDFPELTEIGGRRCHDEDEKTCLFSQFGSDPKGTAQYFTGRDYQEIVKYAGDRFIEVIPCINMAGKARAAIVAMEARSVARNLPDEKLEDPDLADYLAPDHLDPSHLLRYNDANIRGFDPRQTVPSRYKNTGINPCLPFTFEFFEKVLQTLINYHKVAGYDLKVIDIGGDDTTYGAWYASSPACQARLLRENVTDDVLDREIYLKVSYTTAMVNLADRNNVALSGKDDLYTAFPSHLDPRTGPSVPLNTSRYGINRDIYAVSTKNYLAYKLRPANMANAGYSVVLSPDDYFGLEHASEPDSEDFGDQNAIRYIDPIRIFSYLPDKRCCNYNPDPLLHQRISPNGCLHPDHDFCQEVEIDAPGSIVGMEAKIATNKIRHESQLYEAMFPRLAVFAERAWHKARWEESYEPPRRNMPLYDRDAQRSDWRRFQKCMADKELPRLDQLKVNYKVPPPGVRINVTNVHYDTKLLTSTAYPGNFVTQVRRDGQWVDIDRETKFDDFKDQRELEFRTRNKDNTRFSRIVKINMEEYKDNGLQMAAEILSESGIGGRANFSGPGPSAIPTPPPLMAPPPMMPPPGFNPMMFRPGPGPMLPPGVNPMMVPGAVNPMAQRINPALMRAGVPAGAATPGVNQGGLSAAQLAARGTGTVLRDQNGRIIQGATNPQATNLRVDPSRLVQQGQIPTQAIIQNRAAQMTPSQSVASPSNRRTQQNQAAILQQGTNRRTIARQTLPVGQTVGVNNLRLLRQNSARNINLGTAG